MKRMSALLDQALELDTHGRQRWLAALPAQDRDLEAALRRALLPGQSDGDSLSPELPAVALKTLNAAGLGLAVGQRIGPYLLVRQLGAGGVAEVWLAQRADGAFRRQVALKLPALTRLRGDLANRFARECDILAGLEHPNIARLYDAGISADGLPYLAMEFVDGKPLTTWCDQHRMAIPERLQLFLQVLEAVQYAHIHHVIHRDLKPSNILVSGEGQVRLLDFGVAKLLGQSEGTAVTQVYGRALTPDYASPEQIRGDTLEAASDVYALGVVLYELLCGSRPDRLKSDSTTGMEQAIVALKLPAPSARIATAAAQARNTSENDLAHALRDDLDAIVLKALQRDPAQRYPSAAEFTEDLLRSLRNEPVQAVGSGLLYRFKKFLLRRRAGEGPYGSGRAECESATLGNRQATPRE